ncbi:hypothetical protein CQW23_01887 [Capsicum baccatum]|uniref:RING finger and CHY zinc finger domain-containing protein 1 n=1 Tax=Capsicum baccatum TaxID=33114 RepID=A0A2G2XPV6_CAPBA|nr:hypothetical protein CQW23_01887 [Capsicum baccatum]
MGDVVIEHSGTPRCEALNLQNFTTSENDADLVQSFHGGYLPEDGTCVEKSTSTEALDRGYLEYGCSHYRRRCRIRAPCCNEIFDCRHCHNEAKNNISVDQKLRHEIPRHKVERVICALCDTEQEVRQVCINCGVCMGRYFCETCKLFDDDISKRQYHCNGCGICRIGGAENFFHCSKCRCCYSVLLKNGHPCVEGAMHHDCPVCFEYLFESVNDVTVLPCGHTIHKNCLKEMQEHYQCGRNLTWRLPQHRCPNPIKTRRFGSFVMIVELPQKCNFTLWPRSVHVADLTTPAKQEADRGIKYQKSVWLLCENDPTAEVGGVVIQSGKTLSFLKLSLQKKHWKEKGF